MKFKWGCKFRFLWRFEKWYSRTLWPNSKILLLLCPKQWEGRKETTEGKLETTSRCRVGRMYYCCFVFCNVWQRRHDLLRHDIQVVIVADLWLKTNADLFLWLTHTRLTCFDDIHTMLTYFDVMHNMLTCFDDLCNSCRRTIAFHSDPAGESLNFMRCTVYEVCCDWTNNYWWSSCKEKVLHTGDSYWAWFTFWIRYVSEMQTRFSFYLVRIE